MGAQTQDAAYVTARIQTEQKAIDRLKASLQLLEDEDDLVPTASTSTTAPGAFDVSDSGDNDALAALPSHVRNHLYKAKAKKPAATSTLGLLAITGAKAKAKSKSKKKKGKKKKKKDKSKSKNRR